MPFKIVSLSPEQREQALSADRSARHGFFSELFEIPASDFVEADLGQRK